MIKSLRDRLKAGEVVFGSWAALGSSLTVEILAVAGFDWLLIDMEHGTGDFRELVYQLQAMEATPAVPLVRVAFNEPWLIKRTLDLGPSGLIIPLIGSLEEATQAVRATKYPPEGIRGIATMTRPNRFGTEFKEYFAKANESLTTIIQIELSSAVESVEAIAAVPGVDILFVGPMDLTTSLGVPTQLDSDVAQAALRRIEAAARDNGKALGILVTTVEQGLAYAGRGYQFIGVSSDTSMLMGTAREIVSKLRRRA